MSQNSREAKGDDVSRESHLARVESDRVSSAITPAKNSRHQPSFDRPGDHPDVSATVVFDLPARDARAQATLPKTLQIEPDNNSDSTEFIVSDDVDGLSGRLGKYDIQDQIARGGMGVIFRAQDTQLHREVAIKVLQLAHRDRPELVQQFVHEARITSQLQHPGIIPVYEMGIAPDERPFFVMKLVAGSTMSHVLAVTPKNDERLPRLLKIFEQVCQTLAYCHSQKVLHLDLKPENIMVGKFGEVHLMDWGLAKRIDSEKLYDRSNCGLCDSPDQIDPWEPGDHNSVRTDNPRDLVRGTPAYMAPEQARGEPLDMRSDVFGLGAVLCEIITGRPPYQGKDVRQIYIRAAKASLRDALQGLDASDSDGTLISLVKRCLAPNPKNRPATAQIVAQEMAAYIGSAVAQAEGDLARFFELSLDLFCIASMDGFFRRVNRNFTRVLGFSESELISTPFVDFVHADDVAQTIAVMAQLQQGQSVVQFRNRYRDINGLYRWFEWTAKSIADEGVVFAVARDVTDSQRLQNHACWD